MKNAFLTKVMTGLFLVGIAVCTYLIVRNGNLLQDQHDETPPQLLNQLATKLVSERSALIRVDSLEHGDAKTPGSITLTWNEILKKTGSESDGRLGPARKVTIDGTTPRFEALILDFAEEQGPEAKALGSGSLIMFRRIYSERVAPENGYSFADFNNPVPKIYATETSESDEEKEMWRRFWSLATDPSAAELSGVKVRQVARSISTTLVVGHTYKVTVDIGGRIQIAEHN